MRVARGLTVLLFLFLSQNILAVDERPRNVALNGRAWIFTPKSRQRSLKFEQNQYTSKVLTAGAILAPGEVVRTDAEGLAKFIFFNGDQLMIGPNSAASVPEKPERKAKDAPDYEMHLYYGRLRGVISHEGPRKYLDILTADARAEVRGTDFFLQSELSKKSTLLAVLRGEVELRKNGPGPESISVSVSAGFSASSENKYPKAMPVTLDLLSNIRQISHLRPPENLPKPLQVTLQKLNHRALEITRLELGLLSHAKQVINSVDDLNETMLTQFMKTPAPATNTK